MDSDPGASAEVLDLRGLKCPLPALLAKRALLRAAAGTLFDVVADDPLAAVDIPHMCTQESFDVLSVRRDGACVWLSLRRPNVP
jgi:tRNA 2-thiouridine synthesizing protein A